MDNKDLPPLFSSKTPKDWTFLTQIQAGIVYGENLGIVDLEKRNILGLTQFLSAPSFRISHLLSNGTFVSGT